jgi:circadian clock protein KaiB
MARYLLRLYVAGNTDLARRARRNLGRIIDSLPTDSCEVALIDVLQAPQRAREDRVIATPVVVRHHPLPVLKVIGDLSDAAMVLQGLGIDSDESLLPGVADGSQER